MDSGFRMFIYLRQLIFIALVTLTVQGAYAQTAYEITPDSPIIITPVTNTLVLQDQGSSLGINEVLQRTNDFKPTAEMGPIDAFKTYWVIQKFINRLDSDREFMLEGPGWLTVNSYIVKSDDSVTPLKPFSFIQGEYSFLSDVDPAKPYSAKVPSQYPVFTLYKNQELVVVSQLKAYPSLPPRTFALRLIDKSKFTETRRFGLYLEGALLGMLFALGIFGWFSYFSNRDRASLFYGIWITIAFMQIFAFRSQDGSHFSEFMVNVEGLTVASRPIALLFTNIAGYLQAIFYFMFASSFLQFAKFFPTAQKIIYVYIATYITHFFVFTFITHNLPPMLVWLPLGVFTIAIFIMNYVCGIIRYRSGMKIAMFFLLGSVPYLAFRLVFVTGLAGFASPFSYLPESGISYLLQNTNVSQAIGLCCEAMIMALAVVSRTRWLQQELAENFQNQNKVLEETVAERTKELAEQHQELDEAHQLVVGSVNYASRLQRGQLPRPVRIDGRFASFATLWEPRDTIGGDLYWISSSQHDGPFVLSVADCTGHGVPGAMLSLLVSNSLERIYANDTMENPVSALASLDHYVRTGLNQDRPDSESDDGCDATVLRIDRRLQRVEYAGAKIDLFHVNTAGVVTRHMAQRVSLGYKDRVPSTEIPEVKVLPYDKGDLFVIVTDGLTDQVGGEAGKPKVSYGYRRLEQLLSAHAGAHSQKVIDALRQDFARWQGTNTRRDDVTAVVFSL